MAPSPSVFAPHGYDEAINYLRLAADKVRPHLLDALDASDEKSVGKLVLPGLPSSSANVKGIVLLNYPPTGFEGRTITHKKEGKFLSPTLESLQVALRTVDCAIEEYLIIDRFHLTVPVGTVVHKLEQALESGSGCKEWKEFERAQFEMKQLLVNELPSTAAVLIASKSAEAYHQRYVFVCCFLFVCVYLFVYFF